MSDLRDAAELALEALEMFCEHGAILRPLETKEALRQALTQPEAEIERLHKEIERLRQAYHRVKDENERLALDLGIKDNPQFGKPF
jgi:hypothetical protein